jgi:hypothetical protein
MEGFEVEVEWGVLWGGPLKREGVGLRSARVGEQWVLGGIKVI